MDPTPSVDVPQAVVYPFGNELGMRSLSTIIHLLGCTVLAFCFARRSHAEDFLSSEGLLSITWPRWLIYVVFVDSWLFIFLAGVLVNGVGMSLNALTCELGILACIAFYVLSKILIYLFLIEKVYIVWSSPGETRWASKAYRVCIGSMVGYVVILVIMITGRIAFRQGDGQCVIGLDTLASLSLLIYDLLLNVFLTGMFIYPLRPSRGIRNHLKRVARRTLVAATMALITSAVNILVLTILHGKELGFVCLGSCGTDITLNAIVLFWVTSTPDDRDPAQCQGPSPQHGPGDRIPYSLTTRSFKASAQPDPEAPSPRWSPATPWAEGEAGQVVSARQPIITYAGRSPSTDGNTDNFEASFDRSQISRVETIVTKSKHEFRKAGSSNKITRKMSSLDRLSRVRGVDDDLDDGHAISVQVTVMTETDAIELYEPPQRNNTSVSPPKDTLKTVKDTGH